jgi:hypothetical protein
MLPVLYDASMCMAMMNSVTLRAPRCSVSERFQMRPRTSLGNRAFSNISFAFSPVAYQPVCLGMLCRFLPERTPLTAPDFSNKPAYSAALAGTSGGTRTHLWLYGAGSLWRETGRSGRCGWDLQALELGERRSYTGVSAYPRVKLAITYVERQARARGLCQPGSVR